MASGPLLLTKIEPPRLRTGHVARPELVERLRRGLHRRLTLIEAPAGSGKTTLLVEWRAAEEGRVPFAWLSLDDADNDPVRFWTYVSSALRHAGLDIPPAVDAAIAAPATTAREAGLPELVNALAGAGAGVVLVLDDYHLIREPAIHEDVAFFLERSPPGVHLAIASRAAPPVGVARLRVRGELGEVAEEELRFDRAGVGQLLNDGLGLTLADGDIDLLLERTEGWAAGLYLAGLSLQCPQRRRRVRRRRSRASSATWPTTCWRRCSPASPTSCVGSSCRPRCSTGSARRCATRCSSSDGLARAAGGDRAVEHVPDPARLAAASGSATTASSRTCCASSSAASSTEEAIRALHGRAAAWLRRTARSTRRSGTTWRPEHERAAADLIARNWNLFLQRGEVVVGLALARPAAGRARPPEPAAVPRPLVALARCRRPGAGRALARRRHAAARRSHAPLAEGGSTVASGIAMLRATLALPDGRPRDRARERRSRRRSSRARAGRRGAPSR